MVFCWQIHCWSTESLLDCIALVKQVSEKLCTACKLLNDSLWDKYACQIKFLKYSFICSSFTTMHVWLEDGKDGIFICTKAITKPCKCNITFHMQSYRYISYSSAGPIPPVLPLRGKKLLAFILIKIVEHDGEIIFSSQPSDYYSVIANHIYI